MHVHVNPYTNVNLNTSDSGEHDRRLGGIGRVVPIDTNGILRLRKHPRSNDC